MSSPRVLIIGLDGADWSLLDPLMDQGTMPALKAFVERGASATLESVLPTNSMSAWTSFMTGVNPGKHGVYDFVRKTGTPFQTPVTNSSSIRAPTIFETLSGHGLSSCVIDMPPLHPPFEINGVMIGGIGAMADRSGTYAWPPDTAARVETAVGGFLPDVPWLGKLGREEELVQELIGLVDNRRKVSAFLMAERPWDLFCTVFVAPDRAQHVFWRDLTEEGPRHALALRFYGALDDALARLLDRVDLSATDVLLVSDHGFRRAETTFDVNQFLVETSLSRRRRLADATLGRTLRFVGRHVPLPERLVRHLIDAHNRNQQRVLRRGVAYSDTADGISINLVGRESTGQVPQDAFQEVRATLSARLLEYRDPETGAPVIKRVIRGEDYFHGPHAGEAADLLLEFHDGYAYGRRMGMVLFRWPLLQGVHSRNGIIAAAGPHARRGARCGPLSIMDVAPTVLSLLGLAPPADADGRVADELVAVQATAAAGTPERGAGRRDEPRAYSEEEERLVRERLRGLGYIE